MCKSCTVRIVSLRTRLLAAIVDAAVVVLGLAAVIGVAVAGAFAYRRVRGDAEKEEEHDDTGQQQDDGEHPARGRDDLDDAADESSVVKHRGHGLLESRPAYAAAWGAVAVLSVAGRNWRSPGFHVVGLRRVDARTGGPVSVRSAVAGLLFDQALQRVTGTLFRSRTRRWQDLNRTLEPQLQEINRKYAADPQARQRAVMELYKANGLNLAGCGLMFVPGFVSQLILALGAHGGRTVRDRVTGTVVIFDP